MAIVRDAARLNSSSKLYNTNVVGIKSRQAFIIMMRTSDNERFIHSRSLGV